MPSTRGVPVIDMKAGGSNFAKRFGESLVEFGFVVLVNHGIEARLIKRAYEIARQVFYLPLDVKRKYVTPETGRQTGFTPYKMEHARGSDYPDLKEFWHIKRPGGRDY